MIESQYVSFIRLFSYLYVSFHIHRSLFTHVAYLSTLEHTATHSNTQQHTATHSNTLQHTATHCNTLQHTATNMWCTGAQGPRGHPTNRTRHGTDPPRSERQYIGARYRARMKRHPALFESPCALLAWLPSVVPTGCLRWGVRVREREWDFVTERVCVCACERKPFFTSMSGAHRMFVLGCV